MIEVWDSLKKNMLEKMPFIIHPFLLAFFPILFLFTHNVDIVIISSTFRALGIVLLSTAILLCLLWLVLRNLEKAAIICSCFLILFFSYGHVANVILPVVKRHRFLVLGELFLLTLISLAIIKTRLNLQNFTKFLNLMRLLRL
jgi:hypothetical protein